MGNTDRSFAIWKNLPIEWNITIYSCNLFLLFTKLKMSLFDTHREEIFCALPRGIQIIVEDKQCVQGNAFIDTRVFSNRTISISKEKMWWRKSSSRSEQSSTVPVDVRCLRGQWVRRSAQWNRSESRMSFFISLSDAVKVSSGKSACLLLSSSESEQYDRWRCVGILSVTKKKRGWHSSEWCFAFPLKSSPCFLLISGQMKFSSRSRTSIWNRWWWSWQLSPSPAASLDTSVLPRHVISGDLSPSEILVSVKSRNRLEIVFWSNPVASSSGTISSIVSVAGQVSVDHSDRWRLFLEVHSPRLIRFNLKFHSSRIDGFLLSLHRSILCSDDDPSSSATCLGWLDDLASE